MTRLGHAFPFFNPRSGCRSYSCHRLTLPRLVALFYLIPRCSQDTMVKQILAAEEVEVIKGGTFSIPSLSQHNIPS